MKRDIPLIGPFIPHVVAQLEAAYLAADKEALIAKIASRLTAIVWRLSIAGRADEALAASCTSSHLGHRL